MEGEFPPGLVVEDDVASAPKEQKDVYQKRCPQGYPKPDVFAYDSESRVAFAYPAPVLTSHAYED